LILDIIARMSTGAVWPDMGRGERFSSFGPCNTILMTAEDSHERTIKPRLNAAGAECGRVYLLPVIKIDERNGKKRAFLLAEDLEELEKDIAELGNVGAVFMDPISSFFGTGKMNSNNPTDVRGVLTPVTELAERVNTAFIGVTHPAKNSDAALNAFIGSQAFIAVARSGLLAAEDLTPGTDGFPTGRHLFSHVASNLGPRMPSLSYRLAQSTVGTDGDTGIEIISSSVVWDTSPIVRATADEVLKMGAPSKDPHEANVKRRAMELLKKDLAYGPVKFEELVQHAKAECISTRTLERAKTELGVVSVPSTEAGGKWSWALPGGSRD